MCPPPDHRFALRIIVGEIVLRYRDIQTSGPVTVKFVFKGKGIVFQVACNEDLAVVFLEDDV